MQTIQCSSDTNNRMNDLRLSCCDLSLVLLRPISRYIPLPSDVGTPQPRLRGGSGAHPYGSFASTPTNGTSGGGGAAGWGGGGRENAPGSSSKPEEASGQTGSVSFAAATTVGEGAKEADTGGSMQEQPTVIMCNYVCVCVREKRSGMLLV